MMIDMSLPEHVRRARCAEYGRGCYDRRNGPSHPVPLALFVALQFGADLLHVVLARALREIIVLVLERRNAVVEADDLALNADDLALQFGEVAAGFSYLIAQLPQPLQLPHATAAIVVE
jgi:hypothetical protein